MDKRIKMEWVAALRSGGLNQIKERLYFPGEEEGGFCCLGVLCEIARAEGVVRLFDDGYEYGTGKKDKDGDIDRDAGVLPQSVVDWAGLEDDNPTPKYQRKNLAYLNDNGNKTFLEIADIIERGL